MIIDIGNIVIDKVKDLPFIDKYAGVVKVITYNQPTEEGRVLKKIFPVSCRLSQEDCVTSGQYLDLCPDSKKKSVLYLEDKYVRFIKRDGDVFYFQASFDLICWLNIPLLGLSDCTISSKAILSTINSLVSQPFNSSIYQRISISPLGEEGKTRNPFAKYTYDEAVNQFLMHPFDYFILPLNVDFAINKKCINDFEVGAPIGCYTPAEGCCNEVPVPSPAINCETLPNCQTIIDIIDRIEALEASSGGGSFDCSALAGCQTILDLESSISQEETARQNADTALQNAISQEVTDRQAQGMYLENYIDQVSNDLSVHSTDTNNPHQTTLEQARSQNSSLSGDINANTNTIINIRDAVNPQEPITKIQFDSYNASVGRQRGAIDCSSNPNYPASNVGDRWEVTVAGKIGGVLGIDVQVYDEIVCKTQSVAGDQATVGMNFYVVQGNLERASESVGGYIQLATDVEVQAETNNEKAVTSLKLGNWFVAKKLLAHTWAALQTFTSGIKTPLFVNDDGEFKFTKTVAGTILMWTNGQHFRFSATVGGAPSMEIDKTTGKVKLLDETASKLLKTDSNKGITALSVSEDSIIKSSFDISFDGQTGVITVGANAIKRALPFSGQVTGFSIKGDVSGSIEIDMKKNGTSMIGGGTKLDLVSASSDSGTISGWTSDTWAVDDELEWIVSSATTITKVWLTVKYNKTS